MNWSTIIVAIVSGISTGFLTALVTPWAQWAVDVQRDRRESRREFIRRWKDFVTSSDIRALTESDDFYDFLQHLTPCESRELWGLVNEYDKKWKHFQSVELPKLRHEAKDAINDTSKFVANLPYGTPLDSQSAALERVRHINAIEASAKEEISEPLHKFMRQQLARFNDRWRLL
jgi:hypothetical protein